MRGVSRVRFASLFIGLAVGVVACAGVGIGEAIAPAKGATASGDRRSGGDDVVHEVNGQGLHRASGADDGVLLDGKGMNQIVFPFQAIVFSTHSRLSLSHWNW